MLENIMPFVEKVFIVGGFHQRGFRNFSNREISKGKE